MIGTKCPGQDMRYWTAEDVYEEKCPQCGEMIEFFKTDIRLRCRNCKTRVANPRFNMGCAQWCAYAEQCLGPGAKGLKSKSLRVVLEDELDRLGKGMPDKVQKVKAIIDKAEEKCQKEQADMLPVIASVVIIFLKNNNLIPEIDTFLENLNREHTLPQKAVKEIRELSEKVLENEAVEKEDTLTKLVVELINEV